MIALWIALAGGTGAAARFVTDGELSGRLRPGLPVATLAINVTGSLLLGVVTGWAMAGGSPDVRAVLGTGFLGGFTTFSTASVELVRTVRAERPLAAVALGTAMLVLSLLAALLGLVIAAVATVAAGSPG